MVPCSPGLDRSGQKRNGHIYNLVQHGTIEDRLLELFTDRRQIFELTMGALELVLDELRAT